MPPTLRPGCWVRRGRGGLLAFSPGATMVRQEEAGCRPDAGRRVADRRAEVPPRAAVILAGATRARSPGIPEPHPPPAWTRSAHSRPAHAPPAHPRSTHPRSNPARPHPHPATAARPPLTPAPSCSPFSSFSVLFFLLLQDPRKPPPLGSVAFIADSGGKSRSSSFALSDSCLPSRITVSVTSSPSSGAVRTTTANWW